MDNISNLKNIFEPELYGELKKISINKFEKGAKLLVCNSFIPIVIKGFIDVSKKDQKGRQFSIYTIEEGESCIISFFSK